MITLSLWTIFSSVLHSEKDWLAVLVGLDKACFGNKQPFKSQELFIIKVSLTRAAFPFWASRGLCRLCFSGSHLTILLESSRLASAEGEKAGVSSTGNWTLKPGCSISFHFIMIRASRMAMLNFREPMKWILLHTQSKRELDITEY